MNPLSIHLRHTLQSIALLAFIHGIAANAASLDLSQRQLWHVNALIDRLTKKGTLPAEIDKQRQRIIKASQAERTRLKRKYMAIGMEIRHAITDPAGGTSDTELSRLSTRHHQATQAYAMAGFRDILATYRLLPNAVKNGFQRGEYDRILPKRFVSKKSPSWMEKAVAKTAGLSHEQTRQWDAIHAAYLAELQRFKREQATPAELRRDADLFTALFTGDESAAQKAYASDTPIHVQLDLLKARQFRRLSALLKPSQKSAVQSYRAKTRAKQEKQVKNFRFKPGQ